LEGELEAREQGLGLKMADLLTLPEALGRVLKWMMRQQQVSLADVAAFLGQDEAAARALLADAQGRGYVREIEMRGATLYRVRLAPTRGRGLPANLWQALDARVEGSEEAGQ
jgi:hypothetical protein